ncbi:MAG: AAA family ATPase [Bacillota bacterium]|nr:AAA family ATPase [Bacillota bacterium]
MRLEWIKLLTNYKILKKGQVFLFGKNGVQGLAGINGSGKSILLELITQIFVESSYQITKENYSSNVGFEIKYSLYKDYMINSIINEVGGVWDNEERIIVKILNYHTVFQLWISNGIQEYEITNVSYFYVFFPRKIIAYSSGDNEGISGEIYNFKLYSMYERENTTFKRNKKGEVIDKKLLDLYNDLFYYISNKTSNLALLTMFLYNSNHVLLLKEYVKGVKVKSFIVRFDNKDINGKEIAFDEKVNFLLEELNKIKNKECIRRYGFDYYTYTLEENAIEYPIATLPIFEGFQRLYDYNNRKIRKRAINNIINSDGINKNSLVEWSIGNKRVFELLDVKFCTIDNQEIDIKAFSDGEYQFMQIIIILSIFDGNNNLFLFDEPETHFNPSWKAKFVSVVKNILDENSQLIFSTHNSEVLTDLYKKDVISIKQGEQRNIQLETFGTNPNIISANLFEKKYTISALAKQQIDKYKNKINETEIIEELALLKTEIENNLGDSSEKLMLHIEIQKKVR